MMRPHGNKQLPPRREGDTTLKRSQIEEVDRTIYMTTDGREFEIRYKAEAHQAELNIRQMLSDNGCEGVAQDDVMRQFREVGVYVPHSLWQDLMK